MSPLTERAEDGTMELTELGGFVFLLVGSTVLAFIHAGAHRLFPNTNATNGGLIATFLWVPFQFGKDAPWPLRMRVVAYAFLTYAWCISITRLFSGGDMGFYAWASLALLITSLQWRLLDHIRRKRMGNKQ